MGRSVQVVGRNWTERSANRWTRHCVKAARAHGFATDLWTLPRVAAVIEQATGVHYHPGHVWKILAAMEWSLQRPAKRARERNDEGRRLWMAKRWPTIKKTPGGEEPGFSSRMKVGSRSGRR